MTREEFEAAAQKFLSRLFDAIDNHFQINLDDLALDHVCWRCKTKLDFEAMEKNLFGFATLFHKSIHNGRNISLFQLNSPLSYKHRRIDLIELPAPKQGKDYPNGFEHAEFVSKTPLETWVTNHPHLSWNTKNINKIINPDIKLRHENLALKLHPYTLAYVVKHLEV